jgi:hypothetical protein
MTSKPKSDLGFWLELGVAIIMLAFLAWLLYTDAGCGG